MLTLGNQYPREKIAAEFGGSAIGYLPRVNGKVVCAGLRLDYNPDAPKIILAGFGPQMGESAEMLCEFIKQQTNAWKYAGDFEIEKYSTSAREIRSGRSDREGISRIIYLKASSRN
jgi:hypothetical protein